MKVSIALLQEQIALPERLEELDDEDWKLLAAYVGALDPFVKATAFF